MLCWTVNLILTYRTGYANKKHSCLLNMFLPFQFGETALIFACKNRRLELVERLLSMGANPNIFNNVSQSLAGGNEIPKLVYSQICLVPRPFLGGPENEAILDIPYQHIMQHEAVNIVSQERETPLLIAIGLGEKDIIKQLLERKADPNMVRV